MTRDFFFRRIIQVLQVNEEEENIKKKICIFAWKLFEWFFFATSVWKSCELWQILSPLDCSSNETNHTTDKLNVQQATEKKIIKNNSDWFIWSEDVRLWMWWFLFLVSRQRRMNFFL